MKPSSFEAYQNIPGYEEDGTVTKVEDDNLPNNAEELLAKMEDIKNRLDHGYK